MSYLFVFPYHDCIHLYSYYDLIEPSHFSFDNNNNNNETFFTQKIVKTGYNRNFIGSVLNLLFNFTVLHLNF